MIDTLLNLLNVGLLNSGWVTKIVYFLILTQLTIFSVTLYLHRSQAHRGVDLHPAIAHFFRFWCWLTTAMVTKQWVAVHRKHHAKCETEEDPHSPQFFGINKVLLEGVDLYKTASRDEVTIEKYGRGTPDDWIERHLYTPHATWGPTLLLLVNFVLFGLWGIVLWAFQMIWIPFWAAGVVNGLGHWWGYRNFETTDTATNLTPWGVFIGGEELHNNHHAFPSSAKFALRRFEFDIGWLILRGLEKVRLAKVLRVAPSLNIRPNIDLPDADTLKAVLTHRVSVMTDYFKGVITPTLREETHRAGATLCTLPRRLRKAMADGGRWLDNEGREHLTAWVSERPLLATVWEFRQRLTLVLESRNSESVLSGLRNWCHEAEHTGIRALQEFSTRLKGYHLGTA